MDVPKPVFEFDILLHRVESPTVHEVTAEQKIMVLFWMWLAELVSFPSEDPEEKSSRMNSAADIACDFVKKMFGLDVTTRSINEFYELGRKNTEHAGFNWNNTVAATIERTLGELKYWDFHNFLLGYDGIEPYPSNSARMLMNRLDFQAMETCESLRRCLKRFTSGEKARPPYLDAELEVVHRTAQPPLTPTQELRQGADPGMVIGDQKK